MDTSPISRLNSALEGRYRIERELGEGGMATVYLADDLRHERKVALKVLKPELAAVVGADRFLAEIKTTANLNHPHILPLHDSGEADGFLYFVMPFVAGETLRDRLDREKQLPVEDAITIARKVASGLQHAHEHGVVHRDIKPGNILLQGGEPLVADFGIALAVGVAGGSRLTETGLSVGTPFYMSPEQATGDQEVGPASDTYALGCVLYEMLTGDPPYVGSTAQAVLGKIIQGSPVSATQARRSVPPNVDAAVRKALEKLPADRFTEAGAFGGALVDPTFRYGDARELGDPAGAGGLRRQWTPAAVGMAGLAAALALGLGWTLSRPEPPRPVFRSVLSVAPSAPFQPTIPFGDVAISPDGLTVAYQSSATPGNVALRRLDQLESMPLRGIEDGGAPFFSPDGQWVGFQAVDGSLRRASVLGGPAQTITPLLLQIRGASWGPDGQIVFATSGASPLRQVPAVGGEPVALVETPTGAFHFPQVLPDGRGVLFVSDNGPSLGDEQIAVFDASTGEHRVIVEAGTSPQYASTGHLVYVLGGTLMAVAFDVEGLEVTGDPVPVVEGVLTKGTGEASYAISESGSLVYVTGSPTGGSLLVPVWVDRDGREEPLPLPPRPYQNPRLSPDGTRLAVSVLESDGSTALWVYDVVSAAGLRLTQEGATNTPVWISDQRIAFTSNATEGRNEVHVVTADGSTGPGRVLENEGILGDFPTSVTPDGQRLIFSRLLTNAHREILQLGLDGADPAPEPLLTGTFNRGNAEVSPDGRWLVYRSDQSGRMEVYVQPYPGPGATVPVSIGGGTSVTWSADGSELIYRLDDRMMAVTFEDDGGTASIGSPRELFRGDYFAPVLGGTRQYHVAPDGRFLMLKDAVARGEGETLPPQVILVQNFFDELNRLVTTN